MSNKTNVDGVEVIADTLARNSLDHAVEARKIGDMLNYHVLQNRMMVSLVSPGMPDLFFFHGRRLGEALGRRLKKNSARNLREALDEYSKYVQENNLARVEIASVDRTRAVLRMFDCANCFGLPNIGKKLCFYDAGQQSGMISVLLGSRFISHETGCLTNGDAYCEFKIEMMSSTEVFREAFKGEK
ncbi:MAG TPA: V4R domain-containing protein [Candidatus Norongarragalinales archaeon]|jgi:hypothetical protein|nr:V4R domain-containing protein [Candidatus Norongarragalinales archaeon]